MKYAHTCACSKKKMFNLVKISKYLSGIFLSISFVRCSSAGAKSPFVASTELPGACHGAACSPTSCSGSASSSSFSSSSFSFFFSCVLPLQKVKKKSNQGIDAGVHVHVPKLFLAYVRPNHHVQQARDAHTYVFYQLYRPHLSKQPTSPLLLVRVHCFSSFPCSLFVCRRCQTRDWRRRGRIRARFLLAGRRQGDCAHRKPLAARSRSWQVGVCLARVLHHESLVDGQPRCMKRNEEKEEEEEMQKKK